jgi:hypothetical protein
VKYTRDYNVAEQIYWMLYHSAKGQAVRDQLKAFFFKGYDAHTDKYDENMNVDVETQAILRLDNQVHSDSPATKTPERHPPVCQGQVDLMAEDILRILAYEERIPRSVLVDYLKTILSFHLALYHMKLLFLLPRMVKRKAVDQECASGGCSVAGGSSQTACPCALGLVVDLNDANNPRMSELARESADRVYQQIPSFVQANFVVKKLDEMAEYLALQGKITPPASGSVPVSDLLKLLKDDHRSDREKYFFSRMEKALGDLRGDDDALDPEIQEIAKSGLSDMDKFIETLMSVRGKYHHKYIVQCLDALMQKNKEAGMLLQTRAKGSPRRFTLSSKLLEAILQIAVLEPTESGFRTKEIRVEELLGRLRNRYGLYIDRLPPGAEEMCGMEEREALRGNLEVFKRRLREIGFFEDLSDAYVTQKIRPRYVMTGEEA